jgi:hypothetical protein
MSKSKEEIDKSIMTQLISNTDTNREELSDMNNQLD